jgi:hypothetical protein
MNPIEALKALEALGYRAVLEGRGLVLKAPADATEAPPRSLIAEIERHAAEIAKILRRPPDIVVALPPEESPSPPLEEPKPAAPPPPQPAPPPPPRAKAAPPPPPKPAPQPTHEPSALKRHAMIHNPGATLVPPPKPHNIVARFPFPVQDMHPNAARALARDVAAGHAPGAGGDAAKDEK